MKPKKKEISPLKIDKVPPEGYSRGTYPPHPYLNENQGILWRPHNYRRQIEVKPRNEQILAFIKGTLGGTPHPQNKVITIADFEGITIQYKKKTVSGIYKQNIIAGVKEIYHLRGSPIEIAKRMEEKKEIIRHKIDTAILKFIRKCKIYKPQSILLWSHYEDFVRNESYIEKIPKEVIINDQHFKKVYGKGIEFIGDHRGDTPVTKLRTYIKNRALEDIAPEIADSIRELTLRIGLEQDADKLKKISLSLIDAFTHYIEAKSKDAESRLFKA